MTELEIVVPNRRRNELRANARAQIRAWNPADDDELRVAYWNGGIAGALQAFPRFSKLAMLRIVERKRFRVDPERKRENIDNARAVADDKRRRPRRKTPEEQARWDALFSGLPVFDFSPKRRRRARPN